MFTTDRVCLIRLLDVTNEELSIKRAIEFCKKEKFDKLDVIETIDKSINTRQFNIKMYEKNIEKGQEYIGFYLNKIEKENNMKTYELKNCEYQIEKNKESVEFNLNRIKKEEEMIKRYQKFITELFDVKENNEILSQVKEEKIIDPNAFIVYGD